MLILVMSVNIRNPMIISVELDFLCELLDSQGSIFAIYCDKAPIS